MNDTEVRGIIDHLQGVCEDTALTAVDSWMNDHPGAPVVGYLPAYFPRELVYASGGLAVGIWGGGAGLEIIQGDAYFQSYLCHLPRSVLEMATLKAFHRFRGIVFPSICDVIRNLSGMWQLLFPHQWAKYLDLPQNFRAESGGAFYRGQLVELATLINGAPPDGAFEDRLREAIALTNRQQAVLAALDRFRAAFPGKMPIDDYYYLLRSALILHPEEHMRYAERYLDEIRRSDALPLDNVRVLLTGAFCEQPTVGLLRTLEKAGCYIVNNDLLLGLHWLTGPVSEEGDPFAALVEAYLEKSGPAPFKYRAAGDRGGQIVALARQVGADGVIFAAPSFCDPALLERPLIMKALEAAGIPAMSCKYTENSCHYGAIREQAGTFSDAIRLWEGESP